LIFRCGISAKQEGYPSPLKGYGNPTDWLPDDPVMIKRMAILKERQAMKDRRLQPVGRVDPDPGAVGAVA
jgi:hypothetical protein